MKRSVSHWYSGAKTLIPQNREINSSKRNILNESSIADFYRELLHCVAESFDEFLGIGHLLDASRDALSVL